jgi:pilus assembly protein CpaB
MQWRGLIILSTGIILAGGAVMALHYLNSQRDGPTGVMVAEASQSALTNVVVAKTDIGFGAEILPEMLETRPWPKDAVPPDAFEQLLDVLGDENTKRRRARRALVVGEVLLSAKVSDFGEKVTIAHLINPGKRAMAIRVNDVSGVAGFITPGDHVDIVMTRHVGKKIHAHTILQNVQIRGVDQVADEDRDKPEVVRTVTVEVDPEDAQKLALAQQAGKLSLTLRNTDSAEKTSLSSLEVEDLIGGRKRVGPKAARPTVTINRGGVRSRVVVPEERQSR